MNDFNEDNLVELMQMPGIQNQPNQDKKDNNDQQHANAMNSTNPVTNSAEELASGIDEQAFDNEKVLEESEEDRDEDRNNWRDALNDDSIDAMPAKKKNKGS